MDDSMVLWHVYSITQQTNNHMWTIVWCYGTSILSHNDVFYFQYPLCIHIFYKLIVFHQPGAEPVVRLWICTIYVEQAK